MAEVIRMPLLSDTMTEGKIVSWNKQVGDLVKADDVLADVETDKATMEVVGYVDGTLLYVGIEAGKAAKVNEIIAIVGKKGEDFASLLDAPIAKDEKPSDQKETKPVEVTLEGASIFIDTLSQHASSDGRIKASPLAKKLAADKGIDLQAVSGSGDGGRVIRKDIEGFQPGMNTTAKQVQGTAALPQVALANTMVAGTEGFTDTPVSQMRKVIARRLGESKFSAPHFYLTMEINMDEAIKSREALNAVSDVKISFNDMIIKACASALLRHPDVNSSWMGESIRHNHHIHIGSALALPEGLIVPVIKFADQKSLSQIAVEAKALYAKAREKKIQPNEFSGNTFTISNLGMMDIEEFTAIINPPDSCILAVGSINEKVIRKDGVFDVTHVMKVTLSCDHRSVDGAVGAAFLQTLKKFLQNPVTMLL